MPYRQTRIIFQGSAVAAQHFLLELGDRYGHPPALDQLSYRFWTISRREGKKPPRPFVEEMFVAAPATVYDKQRINPEQYDLKWLAITGNRPHIKGVDPDDTECPTPKNQIKQSCISGTRC